MMDFGTMLLLFIVMLGIKYTTCGSWIARSTGANELNAPEITQAPEEMSTFDASEFLRRKEPRRIVGVFGM